MRSSISSGMRAGKVRSLVRPASALVKYWTDHEARLMSDHLPVIADIRLDTGVDATLPGPQPLSVLEPEPLLPAES